MSKHKKLIAIVSALAAAIVILHFVPIDSRSGYVHNEWCIGQSPSKNMNYRWITGGVNEWDDQLSLLQNSNADCKLDAWVNLHLYAF